MFVCLFCSNCYVTIADLACHLKVQHKPFVRSEINCNIKYCNRGFQNVYSFIKHLNAKHSNLEDLSLRFPKRVNRDDLRETDMLDNIEKRPANLDNMLSVCTSYIETTPKNDLSYDKCQTIVKHCAALLVAKMYANGNISRKLIYDIIENFKHFYNSICFEMLKKQLPEDATVSKLLHVIEDAFNDFNSEYRTFKYFQAKECLILPSQITVDTRILSGTKSNVKKLIIHRSKMAVIPLKVVLRKFLQLPNVYNSILANVEEMTDSSELVSLFNGTVWKSQKRTYGDKIVLPLILFFDDVEINNPLGTRKGINKIGAVYCSLPCIPQEYSSLLEHIFLFQFHRYEDHKKLGNKRIFSCVIEQLIDLCTNGIAIDSHLEKRKIYFSLCYIAGDNLGLNTILGFTKSFNSSYCCRMCISAKTDSATRVTEDVQLLRNADNYDSFAKERTYGVQEECVFHAIPNFHVVENCSVDPMHDLFEGICRYDLAKVLKYFIYREKFFSLDVLNERILNYDSICNQTFTFRITSEAIKSELIILTASEMQVLVQNLPFLIGDLIPENNDVWDLFLTLRKIICIVMLHSVKEETIYTLKNLITRYLERYLHIFNVTLKSKHHNLTHYPFIMRRYGPLRQLSCIRFEAKHKLAKCDAKVMLSRKNSTFSLALREQLRLCYRVMSNKGFENRIAFSTVLCKVASIENYEQLKSDVPIDISEFECVKSAKVYGTCYSPGNILVISSTTDISSISYGKIMHIVISTTKDKVFFLYRKLQNIGFCKHLNAVEVMETLRLSFIPHNSLVHYTTGAMRTISNKCYVLHDY